MSSEEVNPYGPANWEQYFRDFEQIGPSYEEYIDSSVPLPDDELEWVENHGFKFKTKLGAGGFGTVWAVECKSSELQGWFACKVLDLKEYEFGGATLHEAVANMVRECDLMQALDHENIVKVSHVLRIQDSETGFPVVRVLLFMDMCNGDLERLMAQHPDNILEDDNARDAMQQVCQGLQYLHSQDIVHFDIKPKNILFKQDTTSGDLIFKLTDFGLSRRFPDADFMVGEGMGTNPYKDPALEYDEQSDARKADVYSLGVTLVAMLIGCQNADSVGHLSSKWGLSRTAMDLIKKMTDKHWQRRPTVEEVMDHPWLKGQD